MQPDSFLSDISTSTSTRTPKSPSPPHTLLQLLNNHNLRRIDPLNNQLRNPISLLDLEIHFRMVEQQNFDLSSIIRVDHPSARIYEMLDR